MLAGGSQSKVDAKNSATDAELVRAVLAGNVELYALLVERHRNRYARYAARMLGSYDAAEDAVQDALVRAFDRLADCREPEKFAGWLFLILRNRCFAERRRNQRVERLPAEAAMAVEAPGGSEVKIERRERADALQRAVGELTTEQRDVLVLKHVEGLAYDEIARITGATVASLKMRMHRAYDRLRELMKEHV